MADQVPPSRKIPPLAIIVIVILAALAVVAIGNWRSTHTTPSAGNVPQASTPLAEREAGARVRAAGVGG